tara:strand:- start:15363 stop:18746 length:3384 start_codon:yes stop_codon:yes gene_type:complete
MYVKLQKFVNRMSKMAVYAMIICQSVFMALASETTAQRKNLEEIFIQVNLVGDSDNYVPLKGLIAEIESLSNFRFAYSNADIKNKFIKIDAGKWDLLSLMNEISSQTGFSIRRVNESIGLIPQVGHKPNVEEEISEQHVVSGRITDENGESLPGATIQEKGTKNGTITDVNGNYSLSILDDQATLIVSFVGYQTMEENVNGRSIIDIALSISSLEEVVVVGYGREKKVNLTGAVSTVKNEELVQVPVALTSQALAGRLPGLISKQSEGKPGSAPAISIRGFGTPLVIVDGIQQDNYYNIDPNEIESFSVLKDAAAAVYGARAGNGVILITTKRGNAGKPIINFSANTSVQKPTVYPEFVDSWEYAIIQNEANEFVGRAPVYTDEDIQKYREGTDPAYPNVNHYDEIIKKWSIMNNYNLNVTGGSENINYFLSVGHLSQDAIYQTDDVNIKRYNIRSNVDIKLANNLSVGLDLSTRNSINHDVPFSSQAIFQTIGTTTNIYPAYYPDQDKLPYVGRSSHNALIKINPDLSGYDNSDRKYMTGALTLKYEIPFIDGLNVKVRGNYVGDNLYRKTWTKPYSTYYYDRENDIYSVASSGGLYSLTERQDREEMLTLQTFVEYQKTFGEHDVKALFVNEIIDTKSNYFNGYKDGFISGAVDQMFAGSNENMSTNGSAFEESRVSHVGRLNYVFRSKYLLEGTLRYDASSRFSPDYRWALFPSISAGWRISEEPFIMDNLPFIDNMKIRASYSHMGYDLNAAAYQYLSTFSYSTQYVFGNTPYKTIRNNGIENPAISWEDIHTYNIGLELEVMNGKLGMEFDYFYRLREGILGTRTSVLPNTFGASLPQENINSADNRGVELVLNYRNNAGGLKYSVSSNFSWTRAKYVEYAEQEYDDPDEERLYKRTGQWTNRTFGYKTNGFFQTQSEIDESPIDYDRRGNTTLQPGMIKYVDVNDDQVIDWRDQVEIGRGGTPEIMYGLNISAQYKGFDLSMLWQGASHFDIEFSQNMRTLTINSVWNSYKFLYDGRWTPENPDADFPRTTNGHHSYHNVRSDLWLKPGDYVRLKNFSVGYSIPASLTQRINIDKVRVYVAGYNALTLSRLGKFPFDPEGIGTSWTYPLYKSFSLGLNISL